MADARNSESLLSGTVAIDAFRVPMPVFMGSACNLNCVHCLAKNSDSPLEMPTAKLLKRIEEAARAGVPAIVFTGGEPGLQKTLPAFVALARDLSIPDIGVRTNGMLTAYPRFAEKLVKSGLSFFQISGFIHNKDIFDRMARTTGAHDKATAGITNAVNSGADVCILSPLIRSAFSRAAEDMERALADFKGVASVELRAVGYGAQGCDPVPIPEMERGLPGLMEICADNGVELSFGPFEGLPPCLFSQPEPLLPLFRYTAASYYPRVVLTKSSFCDECPLNSLCNGVRREYAEQFESPEFHTPGQKLSAAVARGAALKTFAGSARAGRGRMPSAGNSVTVSYRNASGGESIINECIVRTNFRCNQDCLFCFVDTCAEGPPEGEPRRVAEELKKTGKKISIVSFSGGEPALNPALPEIIALYKDTGALELCLQTNATILSAPSIARDLAGAGLDSAFVSLHSHDEVVSDIVTGSAGAFRKTVKGIENLVKNGVFVYISHVVCSFNFATLPDFVRFVHSRLGGVPIVFSLAAPHTREMMFGGFVPRLSAVREPLKEALELCLDMRNPFSGLPSLCGFPLCVLGPDMRFYPDIHPVDQRSLEGAMFKNEGCRGCSMNDWCYGLRAFYVSMFGDEELRPAILEDFSPKLRNLESRINYFKTFFDDGRK